MDQIKIGKFIAAKRLERDLTQRQLASLLNISDKTVSKWETGNGLPEVSLMLPLCDALGISVNELLSGERLSDLSYKEKAEQNILTLIREKEENKKNILLSVAVGFITILATVTLVMVAGLAELSAGLRLLLIGIAAVIMLSGIAVAAALDLRAGTYECRRCGARFVPSSGAYVAGAHSLTTRYLKCPVCGEKSFCRRRLTH